MIELDATLIHRNRDMQTKDGCLFVESLVRDWGHMSGQTVMDIGCGTGVSSTRVLLDSFPGLEKIIATDGSAEMIKMAKDENPSPRVDYYVADIQDQEANRDWFNTMTYVVSIHCFHWLPNQKQAFRNVHSILRPGGRAAILFVLKAHNFKVHEELQKDARWSTLLQNAGDMIPFAEKNKYGEPEYINLLESIGFEVERCQALEAPFTFPSNEQFKEFLLSVCPLVKYIPDHLRAEFSEDLFNRMVPLFGKTAEGLTDFTCWHMYLILRKKL